MADVILSARFHALLGVAGIVAACIIRTQEPWSRGVGVVAGLLIGASILLASAGHRWDSQRGRR